MRKAFVLDIAENMEDCITAIEGQLNIIREELEKIAAEIFPSEVKLAVDKINIESRYLRNDVSSLRSHAIGSKAGR